MTKKLEKTQRYDATPEQVWDMLLNEEFVQEKCTAAGATEVSVETLQEDGGTTLVCRRVLPAKLPGFAKKFVGDSITITETQRWKDPSGESRSAEYLADFGDNPISMQGTITVEPDGDGTLVRSVAQVKCTVAFVGGKIEGVAVDWTDKYLDKENKVGKEWLARG